MSLNTNIDQSVSQHGRAPMGVPRSIRARASAVNWPIAAAVASLYVVAAAVHAAVAMRIPAIWVIPDELIYAELAKGIASDGVPQIRDNASLAYGVGYPLLIAPLWAVFEEVEAAYAAAKALNALVLSATIVPAYFLARRFVPAWHAVVVAGLAVAVPSMLYAGTLLTEVALYPAFVAALLAIAIAVERATTAAQCFAISAIAVAASIKMLALSLVLAYVGAILIYHWLDAPSGQFMSRLREYKVTLAGLGLAGITVAFVPLLLSREPTDVLGSYSVVLRHVDMSSIPRWFLLHIAELDLYLAIIPLATSMLVVVRGLRPRAAKRDRLFAALTIPTVCALVLAVAAYASKAHAGAPGYFASDARIHERATFVLAPLFLLGLVVWWTDRTGWVPLLGGIVLIAALLPTLVPLDDADGNVRFQALALVPWKEHVNPDLWLPGVLAYGAILGAATLKASNARRPGPLVIVPVVVSFAFVGLATHASMHHASEWTRAAAAGPDANWVDRAVGEHEAVSVLWYEPPDEELVRLLGRHRIVFDGEFFNRSIGPVFELGSRLPYGLPSVAVQLNDGVVVTRDGRLASLGRFVLVPCNVHLLGRQVARDPWTRARIVELRAPPRASVVDPASCEHVPEF